MKLNEKHIELFDNYLDGIISDKWRKAVDEKRAQEPEFEKAFQDHKMTRQSINNEGRKILKSDLAYIHAGLDIHDVKKYKPHQKSGFAKSLLKLIVLAALLGGAFYIYKYLPWQEWIKKEKIEIIRQPEEKIESKKEVIQQKPQQIQKVVTDTVYKTITIDPNDPDAMKKYQEQLNQLKNESDELIIDDSELKKSKKFNEIEEIPNMDKNIPSEQSNEKNKTILNVPSLVEQDENLYLDTRTGKKLSQEEYETVIQSRREQR